MRRLASRVGGYGDMVREESVIGHEKLNLRTASKPCGNAGCEDLATGDRMGLRALLSFLPLVLVSSCTEGTVPSEGTAPSREVTAGGFTQVSYASLPDEPVFEFEVVAEIGRGDNVNFGLIGDIELAESGEIFVLDVQSSEIRRFDLSGREGIPVARPGEGPGELGQVNGISVDQHGGIWVVDWGNMRTHEFPVGADVRTHPFPTDLFGGAWEGGISDDGRLWFRWSKSDLPPGPYEGGISNGTEAVYLTSHDPASEAVDSIFLGTSPIVVFSLARGRYSQGLPFTPRRLLALDPQGSVWTVRSDEYRIVRLDMNGDTLLVIDVDADPPHLSDGERSAAIRSLEDLMGPEERFTVDLETVMPRSKPVVQQITIDEQANVWVQRSSELGTVFDVFTREGEFVARFEGLFTPWPFFHPVVRGGRLATVLSDSLDVHTVLVLKAPMESAVNGR